MGSITVIAPVAFVTEKLAPSTVLTFDFVRADGRKIVAVSNISAQFHSSAFPEVEGWCCGT